MTRPAWQPGEFAATNEGWQFVNPTPPGEPTFVDNEKTQRRERWVGDVLSSYSERRFILDNERWPQLPQHMRAPWGFYRTCIQLTEPVNIVTVQTSLSTEDAVNPTLVLQPLPAGVGAPSPAASDAPSPIMQAVQKLIAADAKVDDLTKIYLQLRDKKSDLDAQLKGKVAPLTEAMSAIENHLLGKFHQLGVDNVKTAYGTPYVALSTSVSVADSDIYWRFVLEQAMLSLPLQQPVREKILETMMSSGALALVESRASKTAVEQYAADSGGLPPGINSNVTRKLNVRKS